MHTPFLMTFLDKDATEPVKNANRHPETVTFNGLESSRIHGVDSGPDWKRHLARLMTLLRSNPD
jgi:hypothetical protein